MCAIENVKIFSATQSKSPIGYFLEISPFNCRFCWQTSSSLFLFTVSSSSLQAKSSDVAVGQVRLNRQQFRDRKSCSSASLSFHLQHTLFSPFSLLLEKNQSKQADWMAGILNFCYRRIFNSTKLAKMIRKNRAF